MLSTARPWAQTLAPQHVQATSTLDWSTAMNVIAQTRLVPTLQSHQEAATQLRMAVTWLVLELLTLRVEVPTA